MIDNRIKGVYQRYIKGSSEGERDSAKNILIKISKKIGIPLDELLDMCGEIETETFDIIFPKMFAVFMNNTYSRYVKDKYGKSRNDPPFNNYRIWRESLRSYRFEIVVKKGDKKDAVKFFEFFMKKIKKDYKVFLDSKPGIDEFLDAFISKNNLYGIYEQHPSDEKQNIPTPDEIEKARKKRMKIMAIMDDLDDADFIPDNRMIEN